MVVGENKRASNIMDGIESTGDVRLHDHRLRLKQRFDIVRKLGQGTYGKVQLGINKKTGQEVAIKTIKKCKIETEADLVRIRREVQIMSSVRHPNIVHIYEVFENSEKMILVMEYCSGGELYDYLSQKKVLQEDEARRLFRQIATAVYYCHIHKICHRDLKLENVLLDETGSAKIADFGLSNVFKETSLLSTFCGSPLYASPEIVKGTPYIGPEVDCWSLGVLLYTLVYGAMPFDGSNFKRLVRQISNGDYYEPKSPSTASQLIRDMLTVDPLKRADIAYICDHPWVNTGCEASCLEVAEALAAETPVRLDLLLSLAPAAPSNSNSVVVPNEAELGPEESCTDLTSSTSMAVEPSNSAEKRILELVAEGGEDAIKPSPTRTIVSAGDNKRKLELAMSASGMQRKKERVASCANMVPPPAALPEEPSPDSPTDESLPADEQTVQPTLKSSATITISPSPGSLVVSPTREIVAPKAEVQEKPTAKPNYITKKKVSPPKATDEKSSPDKEEVKEDTKSSSVASAADKLTSLSLGQQAPANQTSAKPKKLSIPGGSVGSFKEQFERRASLTTGADSKRNLSKPVVSKIAKPKAQSEDRELSTKPADNGTVRLQQIGIEPAQTTVEEPSRSGVKKTESEPTHGSAPVDPSVLLQDARRSLQNSMAKLVEEKAGEENRRRAARDIISSAIRTGKPPMPYGRSSSAGVTSLSSLISPPGTPPALPATAPPGVIAPKVYRTEAQHKVEDHRNRGVSVERIIPIRVAGEDTPTSPPPVKTTPVSPPVPTGPPPLSRMVSVESTGSAEGEPIKKSAREFIIPIAVEGKGYVTPRQRSLEPESPAPAPRHRPAMRSRMRPGPMYGSLVSGGESDEEDDTHMHRLRSTRAARAESVSSGEEDEEDEGFHLLTAENLFSTLLHRVRALTQRLNGEEGPGFSQHSHSLFNNLQSPFFNSPHLPRRHHLREGWGTRDLQADLDSMFNKSRQQMPRGNTKKSSKQPSKSQQNAETKDDTGLDLSDLDLSSIQLSEKEMRALSGLTPALSRRLQQQLLAQLPPAAARSLRRTLSLHNAVPPRDRHYTRSHSATKSTNTDTSLETQLEKSEKLLNSTADSGTSTHEDINKTEDKLVQYNTQTSTSDSKPDKTDNLVKDQIEVSAPQFCTLPRLKRHTALSRESTPAISANSDVGYDFSPKVGALAKEPSHSRGSSIHSTPDRPLLSKYLTPERNIPLDESYSSDSGSILSEPSYIAAYGTPVIGVSSNTFRRHSMRLTGDSDKPKKRISRFLRPDFFETPPDESLYAKHKKEKELETQKILREIREKKNKIESSAIKSPTETTDDNQQFFDKDEGVYARKSLSPISILSGKERSRSITPFYPILDKIKEATLDTSLKPSGLCNTRENVDLCKKSTIDDVLSSKESKLIRPKSYPVKNTGIINDANQSQNIVSKLSLENETEPEQNLQKSVSKLVRPKSYPSSSPSPEKLYANRNVKTEEPKNLKEDFKNPENTNDVEVSFSISLPRKTKLPGSLTANPLTKLESVERKDTKLIEITKEDSDSSLLLKKYQVLKSASNNEKEQKDLKSDENKDSQQIAPNVGNEKMTDKDNTIKITKNSSQKEIKLKEHSDEKFKSEALDKKGTIKKRIIRKVSSKSKTNCECSPEANDAKEPFDSKTITKKVKEKFSDDSTKTNIVTKKKSMLQSISHKLEKLASSKSNSPEKTSEVNSVQSEIKDISQLKRTEREQSVPASVEPPSESNLIKRAVTLTDVAALDITQSTSPNKTTVSKVLGLFKKFDPKDKVTKSASEKTYTDPHETEASSNVTESVTPISDKEKPKRPTSLLLNGLGRKNKYGRTASDVSLDTTNNEESVVLKKETDSKNLKNSLKLDFSRLPRVKKIVPATPVIEPKVILTASTDQFSEEKNKPDKNGTILNSGTAIDIIDEIGRSRSRSRSSFSNSDVKSDHSFDLRIADKNPTEHIVCHPHRNHESTTPEKEDIIDRIRRKSFYTRFNEKKLRRKSSLVGPGATEYDPVARIHSPPIEKDNKFDMSPTSPGTYDVSPGFSAASDLSPSTERYRSLLADMPTSSRRYDTNNYSLNDKFDSYRSLDRSDLRKYPACQKYLDYDHSLSHDAHRYARTKSLLDSSEDIDDRKLLGQPKEQCKYNRTISMYSPGNYATYRPKRIRNSAIIMKESEKELSPENILDKIRQRKKLSLSVTPRPDPETEYLSRPSVSPKGKGDCAERSEKTD